MFWNQNIAKFVVNAAPPIPAIPPVVDTQSETVRTRRQFNVGGAAMTISGIGVPPGGIQVPVGVTNFILPVGTTMPGGTPLLAPTIVPSGTVLPATTQIGAAGVQLNQQTYGLNPVVIPGAFRLTTPCTLPAAGVTVVPEHALSLVMEARDTRGGGPNPSTAVGDVVAANFVPGGPNHWDAQEQPFAPHLRRRHPQKEVGAVAAGAFCWIAASVSFVLFSPVPDTSIPFSSVR